MEKKYLFIKKFIVKKNRYLMEHTLYLISLYLIFKLRLLSILIVTSIGRIGKNDIDMAIPIEKHVARYAAFYYRGLYISVH